MIIASRCSCCDPPNKPSPTLIVPTLYVGMPPWTLRVPSAQRDAERHRMYSHAERGNDHHGRASPYCCNSNACCLSLRFCANGKLSSSPYGALYQLP
ncbi:hypothetical protein C1X27_10445 [Pseudomonas sp. MPR-AND1B]|nr:hypothetical protein C1X26_20830 [Pseudomonas sp. MPR-R3A]PMY98916.1 hypothetical protein C1X24_07545 [Pseudomonas sp. FW305-124]PMZ71056.1 hypothetical protein C1X25_14660 [Pseudomonas sp. GW247-3R2A]PNA91201.1 hypothetical protein C1X23_18280 [Pseudomonas sp. FW300-E2]PNB03017.1 hypothetical protein C1X27_10445 [Pseudomonas sp. MPR-AND1B]RZI27046.1 hypothetical protein EUX58_05805 [Pseudomonas sp. 770NI]